MPDFFEIMKVMQPRVFLKYVQQWKKNHVIFFFSLIIFNSLKHCLHCSKNTMQIAELLWLSFSSVFSSVFFFSYLIFSWFSFLSPECNTAFTGWVIFLECYLASSPACCQDCHCIFSLSFSFFLLPLSLLCIPSCTSSFPLVFGLQCFA